MTPRRLALALALLPLAPVLAAVPARAHDAALLPVIDLPPGFQPEGIVASRDNRRLYVGDFRSGSILTVDPRSGAARVLVGPAAGHFALGLALDERTNALFVAGGLTGHAYVVDDASGDVRADYALGSGTTFTNSIAVTRRAAYVTDSVNPVLYELPLGHDGALPAPGAVRVIPLGGDFPVIPHAYNANGIVATPDGRDLVVVHTAAGKLFHVDPTTGIASAIDLGGGTVPNGDGLLLRGHTLYVVQNLTNQVAVVALRADLNAGTIVRTITDPRFDVITSPAFVDGCLYLTNARYTTPHTPDTIYSIVRVPVALAGCGQRPDR